MRILPGLAVLSLALPVLQAGELPLGTAAKLVQMVSRGSGEGGRVACKNETMAGELRTLGSEINASGKIAWASNEGEVRAYSLTGKLVVASDPKLLNLGAGLILTEEGGKPRMMVNPRAVQKSGVQLSDAIMKVAVGG